MAYSDAGVGLNEIAALHNETMDSTDKTSGLSRIPKFQFSFRRNHQSLAPDNTTKVTKSAPNSNESSPILGRSKSLRLPRSNRIAKSHSSSTLNNDEDQEPHQWLHTSANHDPKTQETKSSYLKTRAYSRGGASFSSNSHGDSHGQDEHMPLGEDFEPFPFQQRSKSFSSSRQRSIRTSSFRSKEKGVFRPSSAGRSTTPTGTSRIAAPPPSTFSSTRSSSSQKLSLKRTSSLGTTTQNGYATPPTQQKLPVKRTDSSGSTSSAGSQRGSTGSKGKRPSSFVEDTTADLNRLAKEITNSFTPSGMMGTSAAEVETKSTSKIRTFTRIPTVKRVKSPCSRGSSPSPTGKSTFSSQSCEQPTSSKTKQLNPNMKSLSAEKVVTTRPSSARAYYSGVSAMNSQRTEVMRPTSSVGMAHVDQTSSVRRTSTPTGDRATPVNRRGSGNRSHLAAPRRTSPTPDASGGTAVVASSSSRVTGLPPRTPYRVARTRVAPLATPAGMNELEGAVLLEADDYRKISNDVKSLKTALLKLKRELQSDGQGTPAATPSNRAGYRNTSVLADRNKKIEQIIAERDEEIAKLKKENAVQIEKLTSKLKQTETEKKELGEKLKQMESHRDYLLDKVERLHADKHKLEDRLNSQDKARLYERTLSESQAMEDLDDEYSFEGETLELYPDKVREKTESNLGESLMLSDGGEGESSEPESAAVCSTPISQ